MRISTSRFRGATAVVVAAMLCGSVAAQEQAVTLHSTDAELPYTVIYPEALQPVEDGSDATILTLRHPVVPLQCDVFAVAGAEEGWAAEAALQNLDVAGIEATWAPDFPGFRIVGRQLTAFASGPALLYEGESEGSPLGVPLRVIHAEAVDNGRTYAIECLVERSVAAAEARPLVDFLIANFSTRSDDDRG